MNATSIKVAPARLGEPRRVCVANAWVGVIGRCPDGQLATIMAGLSAEDLKRLEETTRGYNREPGFRIRVFHEERIPQVILDHDGRRQWLNVPEEGPDEHGIAQVVCDGAGKALQPFWVIPRNLRVEGDEAAIFSADMGKPVYVVRTDGKIACVIKIIAFLKEGGLVEIKQEPVGPDEFPVAKMPNDLKQKFGNALKAALEKSACKDCRCQEPHFADFDRRQPRKLRSMRDDEAGSRTSPPPAPSNGASAQQGTIVVAPVTPVIAAAPHAATTPVPQKKKGEFDNSDLPNFCGGCGSNIRLLQQLTDLFVLCCTNCGEELLRRQK